jgi:hypothetical protein
MYLLFFHCYRLVCSIELLPGYLFLLFLSLILSLLSSRLFNRPFFSDKWVEQTSYDMIFERIRHEMNETLDDLEVNELGEEGLMTKRFWNQNVQDPRGRLYKAKQWGGSRITDCETSFIKYMCYMNFPRCDTEGRSLILCRSVCENYLNACGYQKDLWRCGDPRFLGAEKPEVPAQDEDG